MRIDDLPIDLRVGQLLVVGFEGTRVSRALRQLLVHRGFGGVTLFARNVKGLTQVADLCDAIADLPAAIPPISTTQRSHGRNSALRPSRWNDHQALTAIAAARVSAAKTVRRCRQSSTEPMPTTAPIAGASATV